MRSLELNIRLFYLFRFLRYAQVWLPVWVVFLTVEQGFTLAQVTFADGLFFVALTTLEVPTGAVADRWGRSRSVALGCSILALALVAFAFTTSFTILMVSFLLWAVADALTSGADLALLYDSLKALGREREYVKHAGRGQAAGRMGAALATLVGAPIAVLTSIQVTIFAGAALCAIAALASLAMVEAPYRSDPDRTSRYLSTIHHGIRAAWQDAALRWFVLLGAVLGGTFGAITYFVQPFLLDRGVAVGPVFSLLQVPPYVFAAVGAVALAPVLHRRGERAVAASMLMLGVLAYAGLATVPSLAAFAFVPVVATLHALVVPLTTGYVNRRVPSDQRATILSVESLSRGLFIAPLAPVTGAVADARGVEAAFGTLGLALLGAGVVVFSLWARAHRTPDVDLSREPYTIKP
jgi:predicted MFS family arabinose efflux permease